MSQCLFILTCFTALHVFKRFKFYRVTCYRHISLTTVTPNDQSAQQGCSNKDFLILKPHNVATTQSYDQNCAIEYKQ